MRQVRVGGRLINFPFSSPGLIANPSAFEALSIRRIIFFLDPMSLCHEHQGYAGLRPKASSMTMDQSSWAKTRNSCLSHEHIKSIPVETEVLCSKAIPWNRARQERPRLERSRARALKVRWISRPPIISPPPPRLPQPPSTPPRHAHALRRSIHLQTQDVFAWTPTTWRRARSFISMPCRMKSIR